MSLAGVRQQLADALTTVTGVTGYLKPPAAVKVGDAWTRFSGMERGPGTAFQVTWRVLVILPTDETAALDMTEEIVPDLFDALDHLAHVLGVEPVLYDSRPALQITLVRE